MWQHKKGLVFIISGPSGSGKSTLCHGVLNKRDDFYFSISCTTRPKRQGETDGADYFFLNKDDFEQKKKTNQFLEYANVYGNYYGTLKAQVLDKINQGINVIIDIDIQGAMLIKKAVKDDHLIRKLFTYILVAPPNINTLQTRLSSRATDSDETISKRLSHAQIELEQWEKYDYLIVNNELQVAQQQLTNIIEAQHIKACLFNQKK